MIREKIAVIGDSIWYATGHKTTFDEAETGLIEYNTKSDEITNIIDYPEGIIPKGHRACTYKDNIYLIDTYTGEITEFNTTTTKFVKKLSIPKLGAFPIVINIFDKIHIFNGSKNDSQHLIYDIQSNSVKVIQLQNPTNKVGSAAVVLYQNQFIRLGGFDHDHDKTECIDTVMISSKILNADDTPKWTIKEEWRLPTPLQLFGHVVYKHHLIIMGGSSTGAGNDGYSDLVYALDLRRNEGWRRLGHINVL